MPLINIVLALIVVGVALWLINNFIPMASSIKTILNVVVVVAVAVWVLQAVGMWGRVTSYQIHAMSRRGLAGAPNGAKEGDVHAFDTRHRHSPGDSRGGTRSGVRGDGT